MQSLIKESEYFLTWITFWICGTVIGGIMGAVVGGIIGFMLGAAGIDLKTIKLVAGSAAFLIAMPLSYLLFRVFVGNMIVKKANARAEEMLKELQRTPPLDTTALIQNA